jgi:putative SOS response-associated peptidase YedK
VCNRYNLHSRLETLVKEMAAEVEDPGLFGLPPRYNISPTQLVPAIRTNADGRRTLTSFRWGLVPSWAKDLKIGQSCLNARADTVATKPAFRSAFKRRRCLIPADGFYEWTAPPKNRQPYHVRLRDGSVFTFAGLWECWQPPEGGDAVETCTIVTAEANGLIRPLHDRMPVILDGSDRDVWLKADVP